MIIILPFYLYVILLTIPNVDAPLYFSTEIFPIILEQVPHARLFLVGNSPPTVIRRLAFPKDSHIEVTGYVNSLDPFYKGRLHSHCLSP